MIVEMTGNLIEDRAEALVNPVNCVGVAGKGLALGFKWAFPRNYVAYREAALAGDIVPGRMFVHFTGKLQPHFIINFPTKRHWRNPSLLEDIESGLKSLVYVLGECEIRTIAIPALGCGLGGLDWAVVKPLIVEGLQDTNVEVRLYSPERTNR